jgi:hypothetical protein
MRKVVKRGRYHLKNKVPCLNDFAHSLFVRTHVFFLTIVACNVGDWADVTCDYSPGVCSEGGTGVVIAKHEGPTSFLNLFCVFIRVSIY